MKGRSFKGVVALALLLGLLPLATAQAAVNKPPRITKAELKDKDGDGLGDRIVLTYNERINHKLDTSRFPFRVEGYKILKVNGARRSLKLTILLKENENAPLKPASVKYSRTRQQPVKDLKKKQAAKQLLTRNITGLTATPPPPPPEGEFTLTVTKGGDGLGTVADNQSKINCGPTCSATYPDGTAVTLTATPDAASKATFGSWTGCTSTTNTCTITMDADKAVTASFAKAGSFALSVVKAGTGAGTIKSTSTPTQASQIDCGATCSVSFLKDTSVTLTATADSATQSLFDGWEGGGCTGKSETCVVKMDAAKSVTATFNRAGVSVLTVTKTGTGTVKSTSTPTQASQIDCGATCTANYPATTVVQLTATPDTASGGTFGGWSGGGCSGTSTTCNVTMDQSKTVTATFGAPAQRQLTVNKAGTGDGTITSTSTPTQATQINCGATCQVNYAHDTVVNLTAVANSTSDFAGWSGGGCSGLSSTCNVTMDAAKTVTATFNPKAGSTTFTLSVTPTGGTVGCVPAATPSGCNGTYPSGDDVVITGTPNDPAAVQADWVGCDQVLPGGLGCAVTMNANKAVTVTFSVPTVVVGGSSRY